MKRKNYERPTMKVVQLQHKCQILAGSLLLNASRNSYGTANDGVNSNELDSDGNWSWN